MEILVPDISYPLHKVPKDQVAVLRQELLNKAERISKEVSILSTELPRGATFPCWLVILSGSFLLGDRIDKAIDGWIGISRKFISLLKWLRTKFGKTEVDLEGAVLIALDDVIGKASIQDSSILLKSAYFIPVVEEQKIFVGHLDRAPEGLHIVVLELEDKLVVYGIKSNTEIAFKEILSRYYHDY